MKAILRLAALACFPLLAPSTDAAAPKPLITIEGEVRNFSPDGNYMIAVTGNQLSLYDTKTWTEAARIIVPNITERPLSVVVDNKRATGLMYWDAAGQYTMDLFGMQKVPKLLAREVGKLGRSVSLGANGLLAINGVVSFYSFDVPISKAYSLDLVSYVILGKSVDFNPFMAGKPAFIDSVKKEDVTYADIHHCPSYMMTGMEMELTDLWINWRFRYNGGSFYGCHAMHGENLYTFRKDDLPHIKRLTLIKTAGGTLNPGLNGLAAPTDLGKQFTLDHLQAPGYEPWRVSGRGDAVAFFNGSSTRVYSTEDIMNPYADLSAKQTEEALRMRIAEAIEAAKWEEAVPYFRRLWKLQPQQPENMYIRWAQVLDKSGDHPAAKAAAKQYLAKFGDDGQFSRTALKIISVE